MLYTELTKKAMRVAYEAHMNQFDRGGVPYVFHPYEVAQKMETENEVCVALLHDVVEDTEVTLDDLRSKGFPEEVLQAVAVLTKPVGKDYQEYIKLVKLNPLATKVKLADIEHNSDETRVKDTNEDVLRRRNKYQQARKTLLEK